MSEKPAYAQGVESECAADALSLIQRRYFRRFPPDLADTDEPSAEHLAAVDDRAPDIERELPDENLEKELYDAEVKKVKERGALIDFRKAQIKRWLAYQYMKDHDMDPKESGLHNPYRVLLNQLAGISTTKPRMKSAANTWCKAKKDDVDREVQKRVIALGVKRKDLVSFRAKVMGEMFSQLPETERKGYEIQAQEDHKERLKKWQEDLERPPSTTPAERQKCIHGLVQHTQPILDAIAEATGWKITLLAGGPEPAAGGRLNMISVHSGTTGGDVQVNFGRAERVRYRKFIVPIFGSFLQSCYSMDECRGRALPVEEAYPALGLEELEAEGANLDYVGPTLPDAPALSAPTESTLDLDPSSQQSEPTHEVSVNGIPHSQQPWIGENNDSTSTPTRQENRATSLSVCRSIERALDSRAASPEPPVSAPLSPAASPSPGTAHGPSPDPMPVPFPSSVPPGSLLPPNSPLVSPPPNLLPPVQQSMAELPDSHTPSDTPSSPTPLRAGIRTRNGETAGIGTSATSRPSNIASDKAPNSKKRQRADTSTASSSLPKKARIADTASSLPPTVISVPADAPEWLSKAISMFSDSNLGPRWMMLVSLWVSFEEKQGKTASAISTLSATGRPAAIGDWIRRARNPTWRPKITNVKAYEKTHTKWWISVQPRWRVAKGRILADANGDWAELQKRSGINGLLSAIASLFFWRAGGGNGKKLASWDSSVEDFILVLTHLDRN